MKKYVTYTSDDGKFSHSDVKKVEQYEAKTKAENERKAELKATKEARKAEVDEAMNKAFELCKQFIKDYGTYETKHHLISNFKGKDILTPSLTDCFSFFNDLLYF